MDVQIHTTTPLARVALSRRHPLTKASGTGPMNSDITLLETIKKGGCLVNRANGSSDGKSMNKVHVQHGSGPHIVAVGKSPVPHDKSLD